MSLGFSLVISGCNDDTAVERAQEDSERNEDDIDEMSDEIEDLAPRLAKLEALVADNSSSDALSQISALKDEINALKGENTLLRSNLLLLSTRVGSVEGDIFDVSFGLAGVETAIGLLSESGEITVGRVAVVEDGVLDLYAHVTTLYTSVGDVSNRVEDLENQASYPSIVSSAILMPYAVSATGVVLGPVVNEGAWNTSFYSNRLDAILTISNDHGLLSRFGENANGNIYYISNSCFGQAYANAPSGWNNMPYTLAAAADIIDFFDVGDVTAQIPVATRVSRFLAPRHGWERERSNLNLRYWGFP